VGSIPLGGICVFFNLILAKREMYVGMEMIFVGKENREWCPNMRMDNAEREESERQN
jgi:hypothetical protein